MENCIDFILLFLSPFRGSPKNGQFIVTTNWSISMTKWHFRWEIFQQHFAKTCFRYRFTCATCVTCHLCVWDQPSDLWHKMQNISLANQRPKTKYQMTTTKQTDILANVASDNYDYSVQHEPSWWQLVASLRCLRPPSPFFSLLFLRFSSRSSQSIHRGFILIILVIIHFLVHSPGSIIVSSTRNSYRDGVKTQQMYLQISSVKGKCNFLAKHSSSSRPKWVELWLNSVKHIWGGLVWDLSCPKKCHRGPRKCHGNIVSPDKWSNCQCIATRGEHLGLFSKHKRWQISFTRWL